MHEPICQTTSPHPIGCSVLYDSPGTVSDGEGENAEGQDDDEDANLLTFFRTSVERGQWKYDPIFFKTTSVPSLLQTRKSVPTLSRVPTLMVANPTMAADGLDFALRILLWAFDLRTSSLLCPMMNMSRVAQGGRNWEGFGGDPFLVGEASYETILGMQEGGVIACAKHLVGNEQEHKRTTSSSDIDDRTMHETYTHPFLKSIMAGAGSIMSSYNLLNGTWACENDKIMNDFVKRELGFQGYKTVQFCKSSTLGQVASGRTTPARGFSFDVIRSPPPGQQQQASATAKSREAWEVQAEESLPEISPLPVIRNAAESERIAADSRMDRMTIWMKNVEKVVEDAKQNFASSTAAKDVPLPPLPPPLSRNGSNTRPSRLPRRVLAASQIFQSDENGNITPMMDQSMMSANTSSFLSPERRL
ncbi:hypothetical protein NLJ89_g8175 [Agrocybe chaxingu]|uniref:beta-glucosidase n=1 Tax=Agrocybe chaxingu TaxID=84603 RepID=A0A9W8JUX8_9AGAR|nr:hypothetical protein NLJ89_g8175 [Agrocybe chaxingu]